MDWKSFFSGANDKTDIKAVLSAVAIFIAIGMYAAYGIKGLFVVWDMPPAIRDITVALILGGVASAGATMLNQRLGVTQPQCSDPVTPAQSPNQAVG